MDVVDSLRKNGSGSMACIDMHTTGEPTRIVIAGYPKLEGTLLEQRAQARAEHDNVRKHLLLEPRGHFDMYGAVLRPDTELTRMGAAHMGVLFMTNDGYSTMCGHATIALGRFLLDTHDDSVFPRRKSVSFDADTLIATLKLHAPCGLVIVSVPVTADGQKSDASRPVSFISTPSFATGIDVNVPISPQHSWPELGSRTSVTADFSYGGAFYCMIPAREMGFCHELSNINLDAMNRATKMLKAAVNENLSLKGMFRHPEQQDLSFLYSIMIVEKTSKQGLDDTQDEELGLCYFANQQVDRSPTGSGVAARVALAYAKDEFKIGQSRKYHSLVSRASGGLGSFVGCLQQGPDGKSPDAPYPTVQVQVAGHAYYTGTHVFMAEATDPLGDSGFIFGG